MALATRGRLALVAAAALVLVTTAAAADGKAKRAIRPADQRRAESVLLKRSDLPASFRPVPKGSNVRPPGVRCRVQGESDLTVTGVAESPDFHVDLGAGAQLTVASSANVYATAHDARVSWLRVKSPSLVTCLGDLLTKTVAPGMDVRIVTAGRLTLPGLGLDATGVRVGARIVSDGTATATVLLDVVYLQRGRLQAILVFTSAERAVSGAERSALARLLAERVVKATPKAGGSSLSI